MPDAYTLRHRQRRADWLLQEIDDALKRRPDPSEDELEQLARETGVPVAALRGVISSFADFAVEPAAFRICRGTSCFLSRGSETIHIHSSHAPAHAIACAGYCDRAPAFLDPDGEVHTASRSRPRHALPDLRVMGREPLLLARLLRGDHARLDQARAAGVYAALARALERPPAEVLRAVEESGIRGRGGAGFPTGTKWRACAEAPGPLRRVVANGDEGDPGSFIDRVLLEHDPHAVLEGMLLCGYAVGARRGIVYIRSEYPSAREVMRRAVADARAAGLIGRDVLGSGFAFEIDVISGHGSYVCGEETAMLNAIEGRRGEVRLRPPFPAQAGLFGCPTVINNVETLANIPVIVERGADAYRRFGTPQSAGTKTICLNNAFARPGIVEVEFGVSLAEVIDEAGGGRNGDALEMILMGGPMGSLLPADEWDVPICYGAMRERGLKLGHGGLVGIPRGTDARRLLEHLLEFMVAESCGKCVPCRLGSRRGRTLVAQFAANGESRDEFNRLLQVIEAGSLCAFGQHIVDPMRRLVELKGDEIFAGACAR